VRVPTPEEWRPKISESEVQVIPLVSDTKNHHRPGWCTYADDFNDLPELEFFCGGVNSKTPTAAGLWRQGNLLHFGFEQSPSEMNETGRNLLLNSVAYIAQFTEDRPIAITPSVFAGPVPFALRYPEAIVKQADRDLKHLTNFIAASAVIHLRGKDRAEYAKWFDEVRDYLHAGTDFRLEIDSDAQALGARLGKPAFFETTLAALRQDTTRSRALALLARYVPEGPGVKAAAGEWQDWLKQNQPYLFFSDAGGYRYYVDPLAKKRGVPTAQLRGPARATAGSHRDFTTVR
jgi:hypothetical protein